MHHKTKAEFYIMHYANLQLKELIENNIVENIVVTMIHCSMYFSSTFEPFATTSFCYQSCTVSQIAYFIVYTCCGLV